MKNFLIKLQKKYPIIFVLLICLLLSILFFGVKNIIETHIVIEFKDLRPFHTSAPVYFRGFKIGRVIKVEPADSYETTLVTIVVHPKNLKLPANTTAKLRVHKTRWLHRDYIDLIYPDAPDIEYLHNGSRISGKNSIDLHSYLANVSPETYEKMEENASAILQNLNDSTGMLFSVFSLLNGILSDSEADIKNTMSNFSQTSNSSKLLMDKIESAISQPQIESTMSNIYTSSENAKDMLSNFNSVSTEINKTIPQINTTINNSNKILANTAEITCGIKHTMRKQFAGFRLFFGRPTQKECLCK